MSDPKIGDSTAPAGGANVRQDEVTALGLSPTVVQLVIETGTLEVACLDGLEVDPSTGRPGVGSPDESDEVPSAESVRREADGSDLIAAIHVSLAPIVAELAAGGQDVRRQTELVRALVELIDRLHGETGEYATAMSRWARWLRVVDDRMTATEGELRAIRTSLSEGASSSQAEQPSTTLLQMIGVILLGACLVIIVVNLVFS